MAVDREFYVYRFGRPRTGRTDGRADGRTGGRADVGRTGGRAAGTILNDSTTMFIDFHKKTRKNIVFFFWRVASGGSAGTDFYSSHEKGIQNTSKIDSVF